MTREQYIQKLCTYIRDNMPNWVSEINSSVEIDSFEPVQQIGEELEDTFFILPVTFNRALFYPVDNRLNSLLQVEIYNYQKRNMPLSDYNKYSVSTTFIQGTCRCLIILS